MIFSTTNSQKHFPTFNTVIAILVYLFTPNQAIAQSNQDSTIYPIGETMPLPYIPYCQQNKSNITTDSLRRCSETIYMQLLSNNIQYPNQAINDSIQGMVVLSFVVEPDSTISDIRKVKDIGGGCAEEAVRILSALQKEGVRWIPGTNNNKSVRVRYNLPIRFKLDKYKPQIFYLNQYNEKVYTQPDTFAMFSAGDEALTKYLLNEVKYPAPFTDSCHCGIIELALLIRPNGTVEVDNNINFSNLNYDFLWNALQLANNTKNKWKPAVHANQAVAVVYPLRILFKSPSPKCKSANERFDNSLLTSQAGLQLYDHEKYTEAVAKFTEALALDAHNCETLYYRGSSYMALKDYEKACADYNEIKERLQVVWFEQIRKLLCK